MEKKSEKAGRPVLVTTSHRGVFFGYLDGEAAEVITIRQARNCLYWSADVRGFLGLASSGPSSTCRVGPAVPELTLIGVTAVVECTEVAVKAWEGAPWKA